MTTTRVDLHHGGDMTDHQMPSTGGVTRSTDYQGSGVDVRSTTGLGGIRNVSDASQVADTDLVTIDGMQLTAKMARELGLMNKVFDAPLSSAAAAAAANQQQEAPEAPKGTGSSDFDTTESALNAAVEAGQLSHQEGNVYSTAVGELALSNLSTEAAVEAIEGLRSGTKDATDLDANTRQTLQSVETKVEAAATTSAKAELGSDGFNRLSQIAASNPEVHEALRGYATLRALGKTTDTWLQFMADVDDHVRGAR